MATLVPVKFTKFEKFLREVGCRKKRTKGDHVIYDRSDLRRPVVVPKGREVTPFIIRSNLRTLGLSVKEYQALLKRL